METKQLQLRELTDLEDFKEIYRRVFSGPPYYEEFTDDELQEYFREYAGGIFGAFKDSKCFGFVAIQEGIQSEHPVEFQEEKIAYLAELAVLQEYRNQRIGSQLMLYGIMQAKSVGYERMYMRTLEKDSMSRKIALRLGFNEIPNKIQCVETRGTDGKPKISRRNFLDFNLRTLTREALKAKIQMTGLTKTQKDKDIGMEIG